MRGLTLRLAEPHDEPALRSLASREPLPPAPLLVADEAGRVRAALALHGEGAVGDPSLCELLRARKRAARSPVWTFRPA